MVVEQKFFDLICRTNSIRTSHRLSGVPLNKFFSLKHVSSGRPKPTLEPKPKGLKFRFVMDLYQKLEHTETETKTETETETETETHTETKLLAETETENFRSLH